MTGFPLWPLPMGVPVPASLVERLGGQRRESEMQGFREALAIVLQHEGGYVDHPDDPGGATNKGVTQAVYDAWRRSRGEAPRPVRQITDGEVEAIYRTNYWERGRCDGMPWPVSLVHFDGCVNHGTAGAARVLQRALGVTVDGVTGPVTLGAVGNHQPIPLAETILWERLGYYERICAGRPASRTFLLGWIRRILSLRADVLP